jgi:hypothetical protein
VTVFATESAKARFLTKLRVASTVEVLGGEGKRHDTKLAPPLIYLRDQLQIHPVDFYEAIPVKADLTQVVDKFLFWLLSVELKAYDVCKPVAELYQRRLAGDEPSKSEWKKAEAAAAEAAARAEAARAEAAGWAAAAAGWAARAAAAAAEAAARAEAARAAAAGWAAAYERMRTELFRLLGESGMTIARVTAQETRCP